MGARKNARRHYPEVSQLQEDVAQLRAMKTTGRDETTVRQRAKVLVAKITRLRGAYAQEVARLPSGASQHSIAADLDRALVAMLETLAEFRQ